MMKQSDLMLQIAELESAAKKKPEAPAHTAAAANAVTDMMAMLTGQPTATEVETACTTTPDAEDSLYEMSTNASVERMPAFQIAPEACF